MDSVDTKHLPQVREVPWRAIPGVMHTRSRRVAARIMAWLLRTFAHTLFHIEVRGLEHVTASASTLVVANHRRDTDGPIVRMTVAERMLELNAGTAPCFVAREDLFRRGFLGDYLTDWPQSLRELLGRIYLRPFLDSVHLFPIRRIRERTVGEVLEDILAIFGDLPIDEVLRPRWVVRFERTAERRRPPLRVSSALDRRFQTLLRLPYGLTKPTWTRFRLLRPFEEAVIQGQLRHAVELLEYGAVVQLEPEGTTSSDGSLGRLRGGLHVLLNQPRMPACVLPVGITYDFMTSGHQRTFVNFGPELTDLQGLSKRETSIRVTDAMLACSTVTASQPLAPGHTVTGGQLRPRTELEKRIRLAAAQWGERGPRVDPRLLDPRVRKQRLVEYLDYCRCSATLVPCRRGRYLVRSGVEEPPPSWTHPDSALSYVYNEFGSWGELCEALSLC
jgi:1-acyl-sn-glycerol-3-phosphate acyltransferase